MNEIIQIYQKISGSRANGPGLRAVIWVQGCTINCHACFNPKTHNPHGGNQETIDGLFTWICSLGNAIEGITISGGEPLQQFEPVLALLQKIKKQTNLTTFLFSGYTRKEIENFPQWPALVLVLDILICGRYDETRKLDSGIVSSSNQEVLFLTNRYSQADLDDIPDNEIIIMPNGDIITSGVGGINL